MRVVVDGITFYRYPNSDREGQRRYFFNSTVGALHRYVWEAHRGPIADDYHIHHIDGDTLNNDISNLQCLPAREHCSISSRSRPIGTYVCFTCGVEFQSVKNTKSHKRFCSTGCNNKEKIKTGKMRKMEERVCDWCCKPFVTNAYGKTRFCSISCGVKNDWSNHRV